MEKLKKRVDKPPTLCYNKDNKTKELNEMYYFKIDWLTRSHGEEIVIEHGEIPLHLVANCRETALEQATKIAQGMARAFNRTRTEFFYRIID